MNDIKNDKPSFTFKILFLGHTQVGKTSIILRYTDDQFLNSQVPTIGIDFKKKVIQYKNSTVQLMIFDTAGQERFKSITQNYYRDTDGIILVFDLKNQESFDKITYWKSEIEKNCDKNKIGLILVGNKNDGNKSERVIQKEVALNYGLKYIETSALANDNIKDCFDMLMNDIFEKKSININEPIHRSLTKKNNGVNNEIKNEKNISIEKNENINKQSWNCCF